MDKFLIEGGRPLKGRIPVSGSKNAALPILFAAILFEKPAELSNVPRLKDIFTTLKLLKILGIDSTFADNRVSLFPTALSPEAPYDLVKTMRASVLCLGPLLGRLGHARVALPGGCAIGARPVDLHLSALEKMGAVFDLDSGYIEGRTDGLKGAHIHFAFPTVGGTENLIMAAVHAHGETILENAAREPEISDLADYLVACGAAIEGQGTSRIRIQGGRPLTPVPYAVMSDRIEAGTFLVMAAAADGDVVVENCPCQALAAVMAVMREMGVVFDDLGGGAIQVRRGEDLVGVDATTLPYPGFPTDMQAQVMTLMCLAKGLSFVEETIFENRFMHVQELTRLGARIRLSGRTALIKGQTRFKGAPVMASDLRAGAALVAAGLAAKGVTEVQRIYHLDRGYERLEDKLRNLGAAITRVSDKEPQASGLTA